MGGPEALRFEHFEVMTRPDGRPFELGRGAMGITYKAVDGNLGSPVALKVINGAYLENPTAIERFRREARAAAALRHPNVASVYHLGSEGDTVFYAMEFVEGETVEDRMRREGPLPAGLVLGIAAQVCRALAAAGARGLVHRDIKPANLMLTKGDEDDLLVKVIDFGLAKPSEGSPEAATLTVGGFLGTPHFASPEQLEEKPLDSRSDLYSLGASMWFMLAGQTPFSGSLAQVMSGHLHATPPLGDLAGQPAPVLALVQRLMAKRPDDRPVDAEAAEMEILACREALSGGEGAVSPVSDAGDSEQGAFETRAIESCDTVEVATPLAEGAVVGGRYELLAGSVPCETGKKFPARRLADQTPWDLIFLDPEWVSTSEAVTRIEQAVAKLARIPRGANLHIESFESIAGMTFLVVERAGERSLLDVLRSRRSLPPREVLDLLAPVGRALDAFEAGGLPLPALDPVSLSLTGEGSAVRFFPLVMNGGGSGGAAGTPGGKSPQAPPGKACAAIAALVYDCLGGLRGAGGSFVPVASLSEAANASLRTAMERGQSRFASAGSLLAELSANLPEGIPSVTAPQTEPTPVPEQTRPRSPALAVALIAGAVILLAIGGWFFLKKPADRVAPAEEVPSSPALPTPPPRTPQVVLDEAANQAGWVESFRVLRAGTVEFPEDPSLRDALDTHIQALPTSSVPVDELAGLVEEFEGVSVAPDVSGWIGETLLKAHPAAAFPWIQRAAEAGNSEALALLADCYNHGLGTRPDKAAYVETLRKAALAGNPGAINKLGDVMKRGIPGVLAPDPAEAFRLFNEALSLGFLDAQGNLGILVREGLGTGEPPDETRAAGLFRDGAEKGNALCMFFYALCLEIGSGVPADPEQAREWFALSARLGNPRAIEHCEESQIPWKSEEVRGDHGNSRPPEPAADNGQD